MKNSHSICRLPENVIADTTPKSSKIFVYDEHTLEPVHEEIDSEAPRRRKRQRTTMLMTGKRSRRHASSSKDTSLNLI
jgi:hypothetical protein